MNQTPGGWGPQGQGPWSGQQQGHGQQPNQLPPQYGYPQQKPASDSSTKTAIILGWIFGLALTFGILFGLSKKSTVAGILITLIGLAAIAMFVVGKVVNGAPPFMKTVATFLG